MTGTERASDPLADKFRAALQRELGEILAAAGPTEAQLKEFVWRCGEALYSYNGERQAELRDKDLRESRLQRVEKTARSFVEAIEALDEFTCDQFDARRWPPGGVGAKPDFHAEVRQLSVQVGRIADDARGLAKRAHNAKPGLPTGGPIDGLIAELAEAYMSIFGLRPSKKDGGRFDLVLEKVLKAGQVSPVGSTKRRRILNSLSGVLSALHAKNDSQ